MNYQLEKELNISKETAVLAGKEILKYYKKDILVEKKADFSPLTEADKASNKIIIEKLKNNFPEYAVLSEEEKDDLSRLKNDWCWIIDPLDATKEFLKQNDEFTVNIALSHNNRSVLGVIYLPVSEKLYYAVKGKGAFLSEKNQILKLKTSEKLSNLTIVKSRSHSSEKLDRLIKNNHNKISDSISSGSSIKGCLIAEGKADIYYRFNPTMEWDTAAMQCIVEEAGGVFRELDDNEMLYNRQNSLNEKGFYLLNKIENKLIL